MKRPVGLLLLSVAITIAAWSVVAWIDAASRTVDLPALAAADFVAIDGAEPPDDGAPWRATGLPDDWRRARPETIEGWYRLHFHADGDAGGRWAVYVPAVAMNAAVYVDGNAVGDGGRFAEPVARNWGRPLLFAFPARLLVHGENVLHVRVRADHAGGGLLGQLYVGPLDPLQAAYARRYFFKVTTLRAIGMLQAVLPLFLGALWVLRRQETVYGWFAAASLVWILTWPNLLVVDIPVPTTAWRLLWYLAGGWFILLMVRFGLAFVGERRAWIGRVVLLYGAAGSLALCVLAVSGSRWFEPVATHGWITLGYVAGGWTLSRVVAALRRDPDSFELRAAWVSALVLAGCGIQDWAILVGLVGRDATFYAPYAAPFCQLAMGWILLRRLVGALRRSETLAADLDRRVEETRAELERSDARIREVERTRLLAEERERIMREMHDGLGSHLVSTLALSEQGSTAALGDAVRSALEDLRLIVDSLAPVEGDLLPALGQLRSRLQPRVEAAGLRVEWEVADLPSIEDLGPHRVLQVLRIAQEAVTNVLRHAQARTITVRTSTRNGTRDGAAPEIVVEIADDGCGMRAAGSPGRGMENMRRRASEIGAVLEVESSTGGTAIRVRIPVRHAPAAP